MGKRKLGQHFLFDKNILLKIIKTFSPEKDKNILEIGAGMGPLTELLALHFKDVFAIEYDNRLYDYLLDKFKDIKNIHIISGNILEIDIEKLPINLAIGNIPYYITTPIIFKLIDAKNIMKFGLLMQKEVAERIIAKEGSKDYGILSIMCNFYCDCHIKFIVKRTSFSPPPKVDSAFITFIKKEVDKDKAMILRDFVKQSFSMRRKTFYNNIKISYEPYTDIIMEKFNISKNTRAEEIPLFIYEEIAEFLKDKMNNA